MERVINKKAWYKKWWVWALIVIVLIGLSGAAGSNKTDKSGNTAIQGTATQTDQKAQEKTEYGIGEKATFDNKSVTVTEVQRNYDTGNQFAQPESGKEFVIVTVTINNDGKSTLDYNTYEFKMQDSNGVQQSEAIMALSEGKLNSGSLAEGGKITGKLAYEVPKDDAGLKLLYQNISLFDNKVITFKL